MCAGWSMYSPVLVCYHLSIPKWHSLVDWDVSVMLMLDEVWMTIHLLSCLDTSFIACLQCTSKWVQTVVNRAADLSMQAAVEEVKALPHSSAQGEVSIHTWNIIYCCCTTFQYSFFVTLPFHCSGLSQMLVMIPLPMPITQLCRAWLEGIKECGIGLVYIHTSCFCLLY